MKHSSSSCTLAAVVLALSPLAGRADLPVHCVRHQVVGDWEFTLGPAGPQRSSCGHQRPDSQNTQPALDYVASLGANTTVHVSLKDPSTAVTEQGYLGTWTMIYDEGFEVAVGDQVFFAFSHFSWVNDAKGGKTNVSHCDATEVGWYHNQERTQWGCYVGRKVRAGAVHHGASMLATEGALKHTRVRSDSAEAQDHTSWVPGSAGYDAPMESEWQESVAEALNLLQLGWRAVAYHFFEGKTPRQLNKLAGVKRHQPLPHRKIPSVAMPESLSLVAMEARTSRLPTPAAFDWRKHNGENWIEPVVTQGDCGSCYTISTVRMLTARNRIRNGDPSEPAFSVSFPLYCSEYNQGCDGGYGFLQSKWSEDVGLVPETCAPFSQGGGSCKLTPHCDLGARRYRAYNHHYVGGFYGGSTEHRIKKELVANGPVVMSFEPKEDFMYYKEGIYKSVPNKIHQEWEQVDHAVLLIGFSAEGAQPYWSLQNSWGEDGYFRMARGVDESGCESIVVAADVTVEDTNEVLTNFIASMS